MSFEKGKMNFSVLVSTTPVGDDFEQSIVNESYSENNPTLDSPVEDFTAGVSLAAAPKELDRFRLGSHFFASTRKRQFKMPRSRVKEETALAIQQAVERNGGDPISRKEKKELAESVQVALQDEAQLDYSGTRFVLSNDRKRILVEAASSSKLDDTLIAITSAVALSQVKGLQIYSPEFLYEVVMHSSADMYEPLSVAGRGSSDGLGRDFLTWLWATSEARGQVAGFTIALTGMIQLAGEDDGTGPVTVILKDGAPAIGAEVNASLKQGKKVSKAEFSIADEELVYNVVIDDQMHFRGFTGPYEVDKTLSHGDNFDGRIMDCIAFMKVVEKMFVAFCEDKNRQSVIDNWVSSRLVSFTR